MNHLPGSRAPDTCCATLNATDLSDEEQILDRYRVAHPLFTPHTVAAREQLLKENGKQGTWFAGAWCRNGFHEDGVVSALNVVEGIAGAAQPGSAA